MTMIISCRVITPNGLLWEGTTEDLILPTRTGQIGILREHGSMLSALDVGVVKVNSGTNLLKFFIMEGFAEIEKNSVSILCAGAEEASTINAEKAKTELKNLTSLVKTSITSEDRIEAKMELRKAKARLEALE